MGSFNLEEVLEEWKVDSQIEESNVKGELFKTPNLHSKYLSIFVHFKAKLASAEKKYGLLLWKKRKYWRGEMEKEELEKYGWSQWQGLKPSTSDMNFLIDADRDLNDLNENIAFYKTAVSSLEYIMKSIQSREYTLKTIVEYQKWLAGN